MCPERREDEEAFDEGGAKGKDATEERGGLRNWVLAQNLDSGARPSLTQKFK